MTPQIQERDPLPKRVLKRTFLVGDKVGSGGVYDVYLARQLSAANRKVAVKVMKKALCTSDSDEVKIHRDHFQFEVGLLSNLRGGCFTALFDAGEFDDAGALRPYLVTDFLAGKTLAERIHEGKRLRLCEGLGLFLLVAEGLMEMHRYDVVYRDLSPNNVILQEISTCSIMPRLFDFSHAGPISGSLGVDKRKGNWVLVGTPPLRCPRAHRWPGRLQNRRLLSGSSSLFCVDRPISPQRQQRWDDVARLHHSSETESNSPRSILATVRGQRPTATGRDARRGPSTSAQRALSRLADVRPGSHRIVVEKPSAA